MDSSSYLEESNPLFQSLAQGVPLQIWTFRVEGQEKQPDLDPQAKIVRKAHSKTILVLTLITDSINMTSSFHSLAQFHLKHIWIQDVIAPSHTFLLPILYTLLLSG